MHLLEAKSELQNQEKSTLTEVSQGRQQVPPVSVQMTPKTWEEGEEELKKSLPKTAEEPKNQPEHSPVTPGVIREAEHPPVVMDKPIPSCKEFQSVIVKQAGLNKPQPLVQQSSLYMLETQPDARQPPGACVIEGMTTETQTLCEPALCSATAQKALGFSKSTKDSYTWKKLGRAHRNLHISVKFSKNKISARSFQVRKMSLRIRVNEKDRCQVRQAAHQHFTHAIAMFSDIQLREQPWSRTWREMEIWEPPAAPDLPGCAIFGAQPFCEQWDVLHGTLRSQTLAEQSKQQEPKKKWI